MGTVRDAVRVGRSICYTLFFLLWRGVVDDVLGMNRLSRASRRPERRRACFGIGSPRRRVLAHLRYLADWGLISLEEGLWRIL